MKFTLLYKYSHGLVANPRDLMNKFMAGVSDLVKKVCRIVMLANDMDISRLTVSAQQIEDSNLWKGRVTEKKDRPRTKPRYSGQYSSNPSVYKDKGSGSSKFTCPKCGRSHYDKFLAGMD